MDAPVVLGVVRNRRGPARLPCDTGLRSQRSPSLATARSQLRKRCSRPWMVTGCCFRLTFRRRARQWRRRAGADRVSAGRHRRAGLQRGARARGERTSAARTPRVDHAVLVAHHHRRQRIERPHTTHRSRTGGDPRSGSGHLPRTEGPGSGPSRRLVVERRDRACVHRRRPVDGLGCPRPARRPTRVGPLGRSHRLSAGAGCIGRARPSARADLPPTTSFFGSSSPSGSPTLSVASRPCVPMRPRSSCPRSKTTNGSSTPSCCCLPITTSCGSTKWRSTGSTTPTLASTSCRQRSTTSVAWREWRHDSWPAAAASTTSDTTGRSSPTTWAVSS